ncbi:MAG: AraC family ligand binding domain-containing protein, partial [Firmicutes bacterium]|nr:AraC family ligand binding domain-containing protein [Bacillota bacterium]
MEIEEYIQYHETKLHEQPGFSYNTYLCTIPLDFPSVPMHWHEQMEIIYIKKGNGTVSVGMKPYEVSAGCIIPVMPGELHSIDGSTGGPMEYENIIFSLDLLDSTEQNDWCRSSVIIPMKENRFLFERPIRPGTAFWDEVSACLDQADEAC